MSVTTQSSTDHETDVCAADGCSEEFRFAAAVAGSFCSSDCYHRSRGRAVRNKIASDHRFCASCNGIIKDIVRPTADWVDEKASCVRAALDDGAEYTGGLGGQLVLDATDCNGPSQPVAADAVIGRQSPTDRTVIVTDEQPVDGERDWHRRRLRRWGCRCGNIDHRDHEAALERSEGAAVVLNLLRTLLVLYHEGTIEHRPSKDRLFETLREHGRDWNLAIGRCLYA